TTGDPQPLGPTVDLRPRVEAGAGGGQMLPPARRRPHEDGAGPCRPDEVGLSTRSEWRRRHRERAGAETGPAGASRRKPPCATVGSDADGGDRGCVEAFAWERVGD